MSLPDRLGLIELLGKPAFLHDRDIPVLAWYAAQVPDQGVIVEIGVAYGASAYMLLTNSRETAVVWSIDPFAVDPINQWQATERECRVAVAKALDETALCSPANARWTLLHATSHEAALALSPYVTIDLLVIDGDHLLPGVLQDFHDWVGFVKPGGIILLHDSRHNPKNDPDVHAVEGDEEGGLPGPTHVALIMAESPLVELIDAKAGFSYTAWRRTKVDAGLTFFTTVKHFTRGQVSINQSNAFNSWQQMLPRPKVLVFCEREDVTSVVELGGIPILDYPHTVLGMPYVDGMFELVQQHSAHDMIVFVNADMILPTNFPWVLRAVESRFMQNFLVVGQRWDVDMAYHLNFGDSAWEQSLREYVAVSGKLHAPTGKDYFAFKRPLSIDVGNFAVARWVFDNWILRTAIETGMDVVDATEVVFAVHGNHDIYREDFRDDPDVIENLAMGGDNWNKGHINESPWILRADGTFDRRFA